MEIFSDLFSGLGGINWEVIAQLTLVALIMLAGPAVIFVLAFRGGDL
ncbi:photosystem II reaction center protein Ycf12/Psb30 [Coleofasciculus sp. H7-2]